MQLSMEVNPGSASLQHVLPKQGKGLQLSERLQGEGWSSQVAGGCASLCVCWYTLIIFSFFWPPKMKALNLSRYGDRHTTNQL